MADKLVTDVEKIDPEAAREVVKRDDEAAKDGRVQERTDAGSGIVMKPDANDKSVLTYDPNDIEKDPQVTAKPSKNSGEPVHDRS